MKKFIIISMIALAAAGFTACGGDEATDEGTKLKWTNSSTTDLSEINWGQGTGTPDQTWGAAPTGTDPVVNIAIDATSDSKGIDLLVGKGDAVDKDGVAYDIELEKGEGVVAVNLESNPASAQIEEDADARLIITSAKKK